MSTRPRVYRAEGIILRRRNLGEADSIFTVFSPDEGKFDAIARGVRKARSRMRGHLEPLTHSRFLLAQGRTLDVFTQAETVNAHRAIREDLDRSAAAMYCAELVDRFTVDRSESASLFELFAATLDALEAGDTLAVVRYFELHLLQITGFELQVAGCAACGGRLLEEAAMFVAAMGGVLCHACRADAGAGHLLSVRALKVLRFARGATIGDFAGVRIDAGLEHELQHCLAAALRYHLDREPATQRFIDELSALPKRDFHEPTSV
jgi:DNA repair protein RecO (recombination protein O)